MIEAKTSRRALILMVGVAMIAGCKVIPKGAPGPTPEPSPSDSLPQDKARHRVALLVPMTGPQGELGQSIANATTMAILDTNAQNIRITSYDTAASGGAAGAARQALADGNKLILGPLDGTETGAVAAVARPARVPLITFSGDARVAAGDTFVMGNSTVQSVDRVVRFARDKGVTRFALLAPKTEHGRETGVAFSAAVRAAGGTVVAADSYDRGNNSILSAAARLKAKGGYQAVLIADSARYAAQAAPRLKSAGAASPRILGTDLWSGDPLVSSTPTLRGAWFATISDARFRQFSTSYAARFGGAPYRQATLGYDAVLLTVRIARDWKPGSAFPYAVMADPGGFLGLDGPFRFLPSGEGERALEVRETRAGGITIVSPAPDKFAT